MIHYALDAASSVPHRSVSIVAAGGREATLRALCKDYKDIDFVPNLESLMAKRDGSILVLSADVPLLQTASIQELLARHASSGSAFTFESDAGAYLFQIEPFRGAGDLAQAMKGIASRGLRIDRFRLRDGSEGTRVRDAISLSRVEAMLRDRINLGLLASGVGLRDPASTFIDSRCHIVADVQIEGGTTLVNSTLHAGVRIEAFCRIIDSDIGDGTLLKQGSYIEGSRLGRDCLIGPYAHVRRDSRLGDRVRAGNFVEIKNSELGAGTRAAHLSYIGDARVGRDVNIGCGFVTCNTDGGSDKHQTIIEDGVFIGSDSQAVAPVRLGAGSFIATGTTVTEDVPPDAFAISRGRQVTKEGYAKKYRKGRHSLPSH